MAFNTVPDPSKTVAKVDEKIAATSNPRHLKMLRNFREHLILETGGKDVDALMATQIEEPYYRFWGSGTGDYGPKGGASVRAHYQGMVDMGTYRLQQDVDRLMVDDNYVFVDGELHILFPGKTCIAWGLNVDDPEADYIYSYRSATLFKYDDEGNCYGEDTYSDGLPSLERLVKVVPAAQSENA